MPGLREFVLDCEKNFLRGTRGEQSQVLAGCGTRWIDLGKGDAQYKQRLMTGAVELREGYVELPSLLASARRLLRAVEANAVHGGMAETLRLPLKVIRRIERTRRFR